METHPSKEPTDPSKDLEKGSRDQYKIVYVLGGPGSGKSTQCSKIAEHLGFCHLSAGDLLQTEVESGSHHGKMIEDFKKEGKLVPSEIVIKLLQKAMEQSESRRFLIDGFPRNEDNLVAAENILKIKPDIVLLFDCSEEEMIRRLLTRKQGRVDDNIETIKKRLKIYYDSIPPIISYYNSKGKLHKIDAERPIEEIFEDVKGVISEVEAIE